MLVAGAESDNIIDRVRIERIRTFRNLIYGKNCANATINFIGVQIR